MREYHPTHENLPYGKFSDICLKTIEEERYYNMEKIASFTVDHRLLDPGIYVSRRDGDVTTYDLRTRKLELNRGKEECAKYLEVLKSKVNDFKYRT